MTLIIGIKTDTGLIITSDGLTRTEVDGIEGHAMNTHFPKLHLLSSTILIGLTGSRINRLNELLSDIQRSILRNVPNSLDSLAFAIRDYIPQFYADRFNQPEFDIGVFIAGFSETDGPEMRWVYAGNVGTYRPDEPYLCFGTDNERSFSYLRERISGVIDNAVAIDLLKSAINDTAQAYPDIVGGHTYVYELSGDRVRRLE